ncbi:LysR family transcriptional regulator [Eggerthella sinensis]|uniref:LysR family transcriptional regulator n=1 Tax=Eggerthella sinensis TaxID=242230 RepID=UPI00266D5B75|nr:LysR family transcriptional regulator [Eggerthella sinensis]
MRIESIALFLSVVEKGSISCAARASYISQQGASSAIKSLEQDFGVELFERGGTALQLTTAGERIAREAAAVMAAYRRLQTVAALGCTADDAEAGPVRVVTTPHAMHVLSPIFEAYREASGGGEPFVFVEESIFDIVHAYPSLDEQALHLVNIPAFMDGIIERVGSAFEPLVVSDLILYCGPGSPFLERRQVACAELAGARIACYNEALLIRLVRHLLKDVEGADISMSTSNLELLGRMIAEPHTVSFTDSLSLFLNGLPAGYACVPIDDSVRFATGILGPVRGAAARRFVAFFRRYLETVCADYVKRFAFSWPPTPVDEALR